MKYRGVKHQNMKATEVSTNDYKAIYSERAKGEDSIAYFIVIGTHKELYGNK